MRIGRTMTVFTSVLLAVSFRFDSAESGIGTPGYQHPDYLHTTRMPHKFVWTSPSVAVDPYAYLPVMPGQRPDCAGPEDTFCSNIKGYPVEVFRYLLERSVLQRMLLNETNDTLVLEETDRRPATTTEAVSMNDFLVSNKFKNSHMAYNTWMAHTNVTNRRIPFNPQIHNMQGKHRYKRQSDGGIDLCPTSGSFVQPKAAMNAQGNWKYVVNLGETASRFVQLVRAEICSSSECRGTCEVPLGFRATCRQQYVQKRLVSLEGDGVLSTDLFWFPHCCTCQIRRI